MFKPKRLAVLASIVFVLAFASIASAAPSQISLGAADSFVVLAGAGITNTGPTTLNGDIGTFPTTTITGTASMTITGTNHGGDGVTQQAKNDLVTAYGNAAGQGPTSPISGDLGGQTLVAGVYNSASSLGLTGNLILDGAGNANSVWVFQAGSTLTTASGSLVSLINGAQACNVYWQVGTTATLGTGSSFRGTIMATTSITVTTGTSIIGRVLARNGAVTLDTNTITKPTCAAAPPAATATPTATATPAATARPTATPSTPTRTPTPATATPARALVLPATSTSADLPLGAISVMLIAIGAAMLLIR
ncbi:MAG: ice-binding family protein, partial [Chloroflexota bacterium]|nr:ice-binding family protein [Chloroflexota bacterium]